MMFSLLNTAAIVSRPKLTGAGQHWGVLRANGTVAHNTTERGVEILSLQDFAASRPVTVIHTVPAQLVGLVELRISAELNAKRPYDILKNNCETFANRVMGRKEESPQVIGWTTISALLGLVALLS